MAVSPFDSRLLGPLLSDPPTAALFDDAAEIAAMVAVERALARAQGALGVIPSAAAAAIDAGLDGWAPDADALAPGAARDGVAVPALVAALRGRLDPQAGRWLHWGATSQDVADCALALRLAAALDGFAPRLGAVRAALAAASARWADLPMAGRTRSQIAAPTTFGLRVARWAQPLGALSAELPAARAGVARVQFGGAVGANAAVSPHGPAVSAALARELGLADGPSWHTDRDGLATLAGWCARLCAALAKMAGDLMLMGRGEAGEARAGAAGGSSTMPNKANPVGAEAILALARLAGALVGPLHQPHAEERDGPAWMLEWLVLPQLLVATGACLRHAEALAPALAPDPQRMAAALAGQGGAAFAEAASFILAARMPRAEAQALVKRAVAAWPDETLAQALDRLAPVEGGWAAALRFDPAAAAAEAARALGGAPG